MKISRTLQSFLGAAAVLLISTAAVFSAFRTTVILQWEMPAGGTIPDAFVVHWTNDISGGISNWPVYTVFNSPQVWSLTNQFYQTNTTNQATIPVTPGIQFFYMTASNIWGESGPSGPAGLPSTPTNGVLRIR